MPETDAEIAKRPVAITCAGSGYIALARYAMDDIILGLFQDTEEGKAAAIAAGLEYVNRWDAEDPTLTYADFYPDASEFFSVELIRVAGGEITQVGIVPWTDVDNFEKAFYVEGKFDPCLPHFKSRPTRQPDPVAEPSA